jgi:hypothetical protein
MTTVFGSATPWRRAAMFWRLPDHRLLLSSTRSDQIADYDQASGNSHAGLQWNTGLQLSHRFDQFQPRPYRPLGVVLVGLRIPEVHEDPIAHVLRHEATEALHEW